MFDVLHQVKHEIENLLCNASNEWKRMISLKLDAINIESKIKSNPHTMKIVGFLNDSFDLNMLSKEYDALNYEKENEEKNLETREALSRIHYF